MPVFGSVRKMSVPSASYACKKLVTLGLMVI